MHVLIKEGDKDLLVPLKWRVRRGREGEGACPKGARSEVGEKSTLHQTEGPGVYRKGPASCGGGKEAGSI